MPNVSAFNGDLLTLFVPHLSCDREAARDGVRRSRFDPVDKTTINYDLFPLLNGPILCICFVNGVIFRAYSFLAMRSLENVLYYAAFCFDKTWGISDPEGLIAWGGAGGGEMCIEVFL